MTRRLTLFAIAMLAMMTCAYGAETTVVGFDDGDDGGFTGNAYFVATGGNPGGAAHHDALIFFNELRTGAPGEPANPAFLGSYSLFQSVTFSIDVKTNSLIDFMGNQIARPIGIALKDYDIQGPSGPSGVFFELGVLGVNFTPEWTTLSVTIDDPTSTTLPAGWIGFGDEDPNTYAPILPEGASFATVLAGVDEFDVTGSVPGYFFTDAFFDVLIDNISVEAIPEVTSAASSSWSAVKSIY